jgi:hypothetical protein
VAIVKIKKRRLSEPTWKSVTGRTGTIAGGALTTLTLNNATGIEIGDTIIVAVGGEAGAGLRGTMGVGGSWPALNYANAAARAADTGQANNTYAWQVDTGDVWRYVSSAWVQNNADGTYYTTKAVPKALVSVVNNKVGNVLTLATAATAATTNAAVTLDILPTWVALTATFGTTPNREVVFPAGTFALSGPFEVLTRPGLQLIGAGKELTTIFSPDGTPCVSVLFNSSHQSGIRDLHLLGNARENGYGLNAGQTSFTSHGAPRTLFFVAQVGGEAEDIKVTDCFQYAMGTVSGAHHVWGRRIDSIHTAPLRTYIQWDFLWADCVGGGAVDCTVDADYLTPGFSMFRSQGVTFTNLSGRNCIYEANTCGNFLFEGCTTTIEALSQHSDGGGYTAFHENNPVLSVNANIDPASSLLAFGGTIRNFSFVQEGRISADNDTLDGIVVNANNPNVLIEGTYPDAETGGYIEQPVWLTPGREFAGVLSDNAAITVRGVRVVGTTKDGSPGNIHAANAAGLVEDCVADVISGSATENNNQTNAEYEA